MNSFDFSILSLFSSSNESPFAYIILSAFRKTNSNFDKILEKTKDLNDLHYLIIHNKVNIYLEKIDPQKKLSWKSNKGRWFIGMFVNDSDHVHNRVTSKDLSGIIKTKF